MQTTPSIILFDKKILFDLHKMIEPLKRERSHQNESDIMKITQAIESTRKHYT